MEVTAFISLTSGLVAIIGTIVGWVLVLQRRLHELDKRVQRQEDTSVKTPELVTAMRELRDYLDKRFKEIEQDLEPIKRQLAVLADREGLTDVGYEGPNTRAKARSNG
jgi:hypothetical protein